MPREKRNKHSYRIGRRPISYALYAFYFLAIVSFIAYHIYFADKILWKVSINGQDYSRMTAEAATARLENELPKDAKIKIAVGDDYQKDISFQDINFQYLPIQTASKAFDIGREKNFLQSLKSKIATAISPKNIDLAYSFDESKMDSLLNTIKKESGMIAEESHFEIQKDELVIIEGQSGKSYDEASLRDKILAAFSEENFGNISEPLFETNPQLKLTDLDQIKPQLDEHLKVGYEIKYQDKKWALTNEEIVAMFDVKKSSDGAVSLVLNDVELAKKLALIASEVDRNSHGQVLEVENGKAIKFVSSEDGIRVKIKESTEAIKNNIMSKVKETDLLVQTSVAPESENQFGINELIAVGTSKFKGSIPGRIFNIGLASSRVTGTMVAPGETFSFVKTVGEISSKTGYTSAYIISQGRTVLGDGGGVCQVSTTLFRAALSAGLPILERNPHAYRVGYYEQDSDPGIDAAIYSPSVDLKFKNDTPGYILITSEFDKTNMTLAFKIYGTKDGREVEISKPKISSKTAPPATIYEDDPTLPKGQTVQAEHAVAGAVVSFGRTVKKDGEVISNDTFKSNYRAWGAVYKVGTKE